MAFAYKIERILEILASEAELAGSYDGLISGIASLAEARTGDLSFLGNRKYRHEVESSQASVLLLPRDYAGTPAANQLYIKVDNPSFALALLCRDIEHKLFARPVAGIHPTAFVDPTAEVSPAASIGAFVSIGAGSKLGAVVVESHATIGKQVVIEDETVIFQRVAIGDFCRIGPRNRLLPGCVIGSDGYGYEFYEGAHQRVPQIGNVVTEADVDIGANTTIDRARFGSTVIGAGTKIDNLVQIAHNVRIGKHCLIVAQVGISGSTHLGDGVVVGGQAGIAGHLSIGSGAMIAGGTAVTRSLQAKETVRGYPAEPIMRFNRIAVLQRKLPELFKRFDNLEKSVESFLKPE